MSKEDHAFFRAGLCDDGFMKQPRMNVTTIPLYVLLAWLWLIPPAPFDHISQKPKPEAFAGAKVGDERTVNGVKLVWCPPGRFRMGSPPNEVDRRLDETQVDVTLTRGFWMGKYEVTQEQWLRLMGAFMQPQNFGAGEDFPVYWVSHIEAGEFCRKLTAQAHASGALPADWEFRLPTEAQWEYACRAGTTTATAFGDKLSNRQANFQQKPYNGAEEVPPLRQAARVGSYSPNAWGLYDMHGNVWEYCRDWYHGKLPGGVDPDLSAVKGAINRDGTYSRVRRGGAFVEDGWACRSAFRLRYEPERRSDHIGFRIVAVRP